MAKNKFYAVAAGRHPDIYDSWDKAKLEVNGYSGAVFQGFPTHDAAEQFMNDHKKNKDVSTVDTAVKEAPAPKKYAGNHANIFVDGSYNDNTGNFGYGVYVEDGADSRIFLGKGKAMYGGRNIEGEIEAATVALQYAARCGKYDSVTVYHDLKHIGEIGDHTWKAGTKYTKDYSELVDKVRMHGLAVDFEHIDGHTGVEGNEYVDKFAKLGCGIPIKQKDRELIAKLSNVEGFLVQRDLPDIPGVENEEQAEMSV